MELSEKVEKRRHLRGGTPHDVVTFAIRDFAVEQRGAAGGPLPGNSRLWASADDLADFILKRLESNSLG